MKKKNYISPVVEILNIQKTTLLADSVTGLDISIDDPIAGDAGGAAAPEFDTDQSNPTNLLWTIVLLLMMSLTVSAQNIITVEPAGPAPDSKTHGMKIYLSSGTTIEYDFDELSHVTYLPSIGMKVYLKNATTSVDYLFSQMTKVDYIEDANANANWRAFSMTDFKEAWRLEYPHLSDNVSATVSATNSQVVVKRTDDYGITYSVEWDNEKVANRWTCYQLHEGNTLSATDRNDDFKADPEVANSPILEDYRNSGFSRGHLCPSADRQCTKEQNKQTFFLTNMQPQWQKHNGGLWKNLEDLVRSFSTDDSKTDAHCDTLYIVKAATITDKVTINDVEEDGIYAERCVGGEGHTHELIVPQYFYMALLHYNKATDTYHAIAFWTVHKDENDTNKNYGDYAISIDELEKRTGIDFFCNLPDVVEKEVEAEVDLNFWNIQQTQ